MRTLRECRSGRFGCGRHRGCGDRTCARVGRSRARVDRGRGARSGHAGRRVAIDAPPRVREPRRRTRRLSLRSERGPTRRPWRWRNSRPRGEGRRDRETQKWTGSGQGEGCPEGALPSGRGPASGRPAPTRGALAAARRRRQRNAKKKQKSSSLSWPLLAGIGSFRSCS